jgi:hypothetical protein
MNDKLAKKLRATARARTVGRPERAYEVIKRGSWRIQIVNALESTRGWYRLLKKGHRNATRKA